MRFPRATRQTAQDAHRSRQDHNGIVTFMATALVQLSSLLTGLRASFMRVGLSRR